MFVVGILILAGAVILTLILLEVKDQYEWDKEHPDWMIPDKPPSKITPYPKWKPVEKWAWPIAEPDQKFDVERKEFWNEYTDRVHITDPAITKRIEDQDRERLATVRGHALHDYAMENAATRTHVYKIKVRREMARINPDFATKRELKEAVKEGKRIVLYQPGVFPASRAGVQTVEGFGWHARVEAREMDGQMVVVKVLS